MTQPNQKIKSVAEKISSKSREQFEFLRILESYRCCNVINVTFSISEVQKHCDSESSRSKTHVTYFLVLRLFYSKSVKIFKIVQQIATKTFISKYL